jgi:Skp family chaperone for outer membrane proteins
MSAEAIAIVGVGVALLAVLVPVVVLQSRRLEQHIDAVADALTATRTELRSDVAEVRRDLHALAERGAAARCLHRGALTGSWRPTNGLLATAPNGGPPKATAE